MRIVVLTGYASIATAVKAIKLGADDYLAKPVTASAVVETLQRGDEAGAARSVESPAEPMSPRRLEWEHIQRVLAEHARQHLGHRARAQDASPHAATKAREEAVCRISQSPSPARGDADACELEHRPSAATFCRRRRGDGRCENFASPFGALAS